MQQIQEIKLKWFQIRLVHRIIATNIVLMHMGIENDITCYFCRQDRDSINHIFWSCTYVRSFWEKFQIVLNAGCSNATSVTLNENIVLFGATKLGRLQKAVEKRVVPILRVNMVPNVHRNRTAY